MTALVVSCHSYCCQFHTNIYLFHLALMSHKCCCIWICQRRKNNAVGSDLCSYHFLKSIVSTGSNEGFEAGSMFQQVPWYIVRHWWNPWLLSMYLQHTLTLVFIYRLPFRLVYIICLLLPTRLECHLTSLTVNANLMRRSFFGPSWGRLLYFPLAVSINGASKHYADGFWISTCPSTDSDSPFAIVLLFCSRLCPVIPFLLLLFAFPCTWF